MKKFLTASLAIAAVLALGASARAAGTRVLGTSHVPWATLQDAEVVPGRLIVGYRDGVVATRAVASPAEHAWTPPAHMVRTRARAGVTLNRTFRRLNAEVVDVPGAAGLDDLRAAAETLAEDPAVAYVEPVYLRHATAVPDDPQYDQLWGMADIGAEEVWDLSTGSRDIVVAVIDSGVRVTHEDLVANIWTNPGEIPDNGEDDDGNGYIDDVCGWDFVEGDNTPQDENSHGTHVAGTIGAVGNNRTGVAGVNWNVSILPVRGLDAQGYGGDELIDAIEYVAWFDGKNGRPRVHLSNNSWGGGRYSEAERTAIVHAQEAGQLFIAAAGNETSDNDAHFTSPCCYDLENIISVASLDKGDKISTFSNYGATSVDLGAPGGDIYSCGIQSDSNYTIKSGTSMASPHVAGAAALLWSIAPDVPYTVIRDAIFHSAEANPVPSLDGRCVTGGKLYLPDALAYIGSLIVSPIDDQKWFGPVGGPFSPDTAVFSLMNPSSGDVTVTISNTESWVELDIDSLNLASGEAATVTASPSADAFALPEGIYEATIVFTYDDGEGGGTVERVVRLKISENYVSQSIVDPSWTEASGKSEAVTDLDAGVAIEVELDAPFRYYNADYSNITVFACGAIAFGDSSLPSANTDLPTDITEDALACPWWDALSPVAESQITIATNETGATIISWEDFALAADPDARISFQTVLTPAADANGTIAFYVRDAAMDSPAGFARSATVGLQDDGAFQSCLYAFNGENPDYGTFWLADDQGLLFTWKDPLPDSEAPYVESIERLSIVPGTDGGRGKAVLAVRFSEIVTGIDASAFTFDGSTIGGTPVVTDIAGGGEYFIVTIEEFTGYGRLNVALLAGATQDLAGNESEASDAFSVAMPYREVQFFDDFESGAKGWTTSTNDYSQATADVWELGTPPAEYPGECSGPVEAASGSTCWGTILDGPYPKLANASLQAPRVYVGEGAVVEFQVAADLGYGQVDPVACDGDYLVLEASADGGAWEIVGSIDLMAYLNGYSDVPAISGGDWETFSAPLPAAYANRAVDLRLRFVSDRSDVVLIDGYSIPDGAGIYVDDFMVSSLHDDGVWLVSATPSELSPASTADLDATLYCASGEPLSDVTGVFGIADSAVAITAGAEQSYGDLEPGDMISNVVVSIELAAASRFTSAAIPLRHDAWAQGEYLNGNEAILTILDIDPAAADTQLEAFTSTGVTDWLGRPLDGDGSDTASIVQIIWAGDDGLIDPADESGAPTGDDQVLYATPSGKPFIRIGAGRGVQADLGLFDGIVLHGLPAGAALYARAWADPSFAEAVAYGDSEIRAITGEAGEAIDFGSWTVGTPVHYDRDSNGDAIPDGWCVLDGLDPFEEIAPIDPSMEVLDSFTGKNSDASSDNDLVAPRRAIVAGDYVVVASRRSGASSRPSIPGAVQVYSIDLQTRVGSIDSIVAADGKTYSIDPLALAWDEGSSVLAVADTDRVLFFDFDSASGALSYRSALPEYGTTGLPTDPGRFKDIRDVAWSSEIGAFYVIDSKLVNMGSDSYYRVQKIADDLATADIVFALDYGAELFPVPPSAIAFDGSSCYIANPGYASIEWFSVFPDGSLYWIDFFDLTGIPPGTPIYGDFTTSWPAGLSCDGNGLLYVAERDTHAIRLIDTASGETLSLFPANADISPSYGLEDGKFHSPEGVFAASGDLAASRGVLVADTGNNRVLWLNLSCDSDGDGMDDLWEFQNGLVVGVDDSMDDPDGDGLPNIGEQRAGTDPAEPDTNGNGGGDLWDMQNRIDPVEPSDPVDPLKIVSVVATPEGVVFAEGSNVVVTVTFSAEVDPDAAVKLALSGGATASAAAMTRVDATTYTFEYTVDGDDEGWVSATVSGARGTDGLVSDPSSYTAEDLFEVEGSVVADPPEVVSIVGSPDPAAAGQDVTITVTFDRDIDPASAVVVTLSGGASGTVELVQDTTDAAVFTGAYAVQGSDFGAVTGVVSGAASVGGSEMDPSDPEYIFTVEAAEFSITAIGLNPFFLEWEAVEGATYAARSSDTLDSEGFTNVVFSGFVSPVTGIAGWTNATYDAVSPQFYKVYRTEPGQ